MANERRITLFERAGCHLCEDARVVLDEMVGPDGYRRIDVDADDELIVRYGFRVPVVSLDGIDRLEAPMTAGELRNLLR